MTSSLRAKRSNLDGQLAAGSRLLRRCAPRNDGKTLQNRDDLSVGALGGWEALHLVGERIEVYRAVGEGDFPVVVLPRAGVLQPIHVITFRKILARLRPARFGTRGRGVRH